jgi:replicative DNA helicase
MERQSEILDRLPPSSDEAEMCVIGSLFLRLDLIDTARLMLSPDDFYSEANRIIYRHLIALHGLGFGPDILLVKERLLRHGQLEQVGVAHLLECARAVPTATNLEEYARIVKRASRLRRAISIAKEVLQACYADGADPDWISEVGSSKLREV